MIKKIDVNGYNRPDNEKLASSLDLSDFINLEELDCSNNQLMALKLDNCLGLKKIACSHNQLTQLDLTNLSQLKEIYCIGNYLQDLKLPLSAEQLTNLNIAGNNLPEQDLSMFSRFINLEMLSIGGGEGYLSPGNKKKVQHRIKQGIYNRFVGSLEPLKNLTKLRKLYISNTDLNGGVECLSESIKEIDYSTKMIPQSKVREIV